MSTKTLLTGATDGIGKQTALELTNKGFDLIIHGRNAEKTEKAANEIKQLTGIKPATVSADFSSLNEVKQMAEDMLMAHDHLDMLINNAGVISKGKTESADGFELTFAVNHLAPFYLTNKLLPLILKSEEAIIINVSSQAHAHHINLNDLQFSNSYSNMQLYGLSKLCNILITYHLADMLEDKHIKINCLHPGVINTKMLRQNYGNIGSSVEKGAQNILSVAISDENRNVSGAYFVNGRKTKSAAISYDKDIQKELWDKSASYITNSVHESKKTFEIERLI
jgi:NAD(P)-dependent dehydrogenase (short-subunit alcohol dehydrogenase family)